MRIISWNVNGIRSVLQKGFLQFLKKEKPDILCLQETKTGKGGVELITPGYEQFWNHAKRPGYSGTAIFTKIKPLSVKNDMGISLHDTEGRLITMELNDFYLVNVYIPNSKRDLSRLDYRSEQWDRDFLKYCKTLEKKKPVLFCGDMNVAHKEIDLTYPKANVKNHGFTPQERAGFDKIIEAGFIDTFREFCQEPGRYTWWSRFANCRARNIGWRIDYFCTSKSFRPWLRDSFILKDVMGSDHCPIGIEIV